MKELLITFSSLVVTGLGSLSYTHPRFAIKLFSLLVIIFICVQVALSEYRSVLSDDQIMTERAIVGSFLPCDSLVKIDGDMSFQTRVRRYKLLVQEYEKLKGSVSEVLLSSSDRMKQVDKSCDYFFYISYAVIMVLGIFSFQFLIYKENH